MTFSEGNEALPALRPWQRWIALVVLSSSIALLVCLSIFCLDMMSAARGYVSGESLWSKSQKEAVQQLLRYASTRSSEDWEAYRTAIAVPLGDRIAREELEKPDPDLAVVRRGFLDGHNHPDDFDGMVRLFRWFRGVRFLERAIRTWERGDALIAELVAAADDLHRGVQSGADAAALAPALERIRTLDIALRPLEVEFSEALGAATRRTRVLLSAGLMVAGVILIAAGTYAVRLLVRRRELYESALRSSEERFRRALEGARDGIWEWNPHSGTMYFSPRCEALLGIAPGALPRVHRQLAPWFHPDDLPGVRAATQAHLLHGAPYDVEFRLRVGDRWHWVRSRGQALVDPESSELRMVGSLSDVDERRTAEEALRESEIRYRTLWETTSDAVLIVNEHHEIEFANHAVQALLGFQPTELIGRPMALIQPQALHQTHRAGVARYLASEERRLDWRGVELRAVRRDGSEVPVEVSFGEMELKGKRYFVGFLRDISRRKEAAAALYEANERLEQRVAERTAELTEANRRLREFDR